MTAFQLLPMGLGGVAIFWPFMGIALWILLIALIVLLVRGARTTTSDSGGSAVRLLEERYARGEITREDFVERRAVLGGMSSDAAGEDSR
jgi:putative membrane protein